MSDLFDRRISFAGGNSGKDWVTCLKSTSECTCSCIIPEGIPVPARIPEDELLEDLQRCKELVDGTLTFDKYDELGEFSPQTCTARFGSWNNAKEEAGISTDDFETFPKKSTDVTEDDIIEDVRRAAEEVDGFLSASKYQEVGNHSLNTIQERIGWNTAKRKAGLDVVGFPGDGRQNPMQHEAVHQEVCDTLSAMGARGELPVQNDPELAHEIAKKAAASRDQERLSMIMKAKWRQGEISLWHDKGDDHPTENSVTVECEWCGTDLKRQPHRVEQFERQFCDMRCQGRWFSEHRSGENSHHWIESTVTCDYCGEEFHRPSSDMYDHNFCDEDCRNKWLSEVRVGENHPLWEGCSEYVYYGPNWHQQRKKALERDDYTCQRCGAEPDEIGRNPDVHHIDRTALVNGDYETANRLDNLICLCRTCHNAMERLPVKIDTGQRQAG